MDYQWYPGHMTRARRMMEENIRLVDLVIELVDARIPLSSRNPDIDALCRGKGRIVLMCKADLADPAVTEQFQEYFRQKGILSTAVDAREKKTGEVVRRFVQEACREKIEKDRARGIIGRPLRAMVAGIPNVGKSTFINSFSGRASTRTGNKPGVTRGKQWIRLDSSVELLDTPGILWPKFDSRETGMRLALVGAIRDDILDRQELAMWLLGYLQKVYPGAIEDKYLKSAGPDVSEEEYPGLSGVPAEYSLLLKIAGARGFVMKGGVPDPDRTAAMLLDDCRNGRIGRISLDSPEDAPLFDMRRAQMQDSITSVRMQGEEPGRKKGQAAGRNKGFSAGKNSGGSAAGKNSGSAGKKQSGPAGGRTSAAAGAGNAGPGGRKKGSFSAGKTGASAAGRKGGGSAGRKNSGRK